MLKIKEAGNKLTKTFTINSVLFFDLLKILGVTDNHQYIPRGVVRFWKVVAYPGQRHTT